MLNFRASQTKDIAKESWSILCLSESLPSVHGAPENDGTLPLRKKSK
jgi:hypothetical protein